MNNDTAYIIGFRYPHPAEQKLQYFIDDQGDFSIDDLIKHAAGFKLQEQAAAFCQEIIDAELGLFPMQATRAALFKFHLLAYRTKVKPAFNEEPYVKFFFLEGVKMDIIRIKYPEGTVDPEVVQTFDLEWTDWT